MPRPKQQTAFVSRDVSLHQPLTTPTMTLKSVVHRSTVNWTTMVRILRNFVLSTVRLGRLLIRPMWRSCVLMYVPKIPVMLTGMVMWRPVRGFVWLVVPRCRWGLLIQLPNYVLRSVPVPCMGIPLPENVYHSVLILISLISLHEDAFQDVQTHSSVMIPPLSDSVILTQLSVEQDSETLTKIFALENAQDPLQSVILDILMTVCKVSLFLTLACPSGTYADSYNSARLCVTDCNDYSGSGGPDLYGDPLTRTCEPKCIKPLTWADFQTRDCQSPCSALPIPTYA